jgi:lactate 2-monooxygenase
MRPAMSIHQYGDYQFEIYFDGLEGPMPKYPVDLADGLPVLFDSGVRSGCDVAKALALAATAIGVGRPYAYPLAVGGSDAVVSQRRALLAGLDPLMAIDGFLAITDLCAADAQRI